MPELSLHFPPACRRFLAGGPEQLRLSLPAAGVVTAGGAILLGANLAVAIFRPAAGATMPWLSAATATLAAVLLAAVAARWLGSRLGALAGLAQLTTLGVLLPGPSASAGMPFCLAVSGAMGAFALGNVPGRLPLVDRQWTRRAFYAAAGVSLVLAGPAGPALIFAGCLLFLISRVDSRGLRFFADPLGIALFALLAAVPCMVPEAWTGTRVELWGCSGEALGPRMSLPDVLGWLAVAGLPWTPLAALAVVVGLRQGHYATPVWRFLGCWLLAPLGLAAFGPLTHKLHLTALIPPMAVIAAAGLSAVYIRCRRG